LSFKNQIISNKKWKQNALYANVSIYSSKVYVINLLLSHGKFEMNTDFYYKCNGYNNLISEGKVERKDLFMIVADLL